MKSFINFLRVIVIVLISCSFSQIDAAKQRPLKSVDKYVLTICMVFNNEAPWLKEWIEYHQVVGVQHFYLYNNRSTDDFKKVLRPYIKKGIVTLIDWPYGNEENYVTEAQQTAYQNAFQTYGSQTKWMAIIDSDEFLVPVKEYSLIDILTDYEDYGGLAVNWQMFGTSNVAKINADELMIEKLTWMGLPSMSGNMHVKTIVRTDRVDPNIKGLHCFSYLLGYFTVNSDGHPSGGSMSHVCIDRIQLNHYWTRDEEYFNTYKVPRRIACAHDTRETLDAHLKNLHQVEGDTILKFVPELKKRMWRKN